MEKQPDIRIFIACHKPTYVPENPIFYPVQVGTALTEKRLEHMAYRDNEGDNISGKNPDYCELTAQYWAWKNIDCDYYGFFHYRRYLTFHRVCSVMASGRILGKRQHEAGYLVKVIETTGIRASGEKILCDNAEVESWITPDTMVSMNMWAGTSDFLEYIDKGFSRFLDNLGDNLEKKEYLLPNIVAELLEKNLASVKVLNTSDRWIGITYKEDIEPAQEKFRQMIDSGVYPKNLWQ